MLVCLDETVRLTKRPDLGGFIWSDRLGGFMHGIGLFHGPTPPRCTKWGWWEAMWKQMHGCVCDRCGAML